jgi:hypothetical protein
MKKQTSIIKYNSAKHDNGMKFLSNTVIRTFFFMFHSFFNRLLTYNFYAKFETNSIVFFLSLCVVIY